MIISMLKSHGKMDPKNYTKIDDKVDDEIDAKIDAKIDVEIDAEIDYEICDESDEQGQPAAFLYRISWKKTAVVKSVTLESGDALVFGGRSRGIIHSVPGIGTASAAVAKAASKPATFPASRKSSALARGVESKGQGEGRTRGEGSEGGGGNGPCVVPDCGRYNLNFREL